MRAIAEISLERTLARAEELARLWTMALLVVRPLEDFGGLPLEEIAREGPSLCLQVLRAVQSDGELDRLTGEGPSTGREQSAPARRIGELAGARNAVGVVEAVEALRGVLWEAMLEEVSFAGDPRSASRQLADLSDRLAYVCSRAMAAGVCSLQPEAAAREAEATAPTAASTSTREGKVTQPARTRAVIVDELIERPARETSVSPPGPERRPVAIGEDPPVAGCREGPASSSVEVETERPLSWDESPPIPPRPESEEIEIRDERGEDGPAAWIGSIGRQLTRYADDGVPFAVLLVEPLPLDRLRSPGGQAELQLLAEQLEEALMAVWPGSLTRQRLGRYWLLAPATNRLGVRELVTRLREAVAAAVTYRGEPLQLALGTATCPDEGLEASALAAHADVGLYADRAASARAHATADEPA